MSTRELAGPMKHVAVALLAAASVLLGPARIAAQGGMMPPFPPGLPPVQAPPQNPITPQKAILGKFLFWDEQLSSDNTVACATCHMPEGGGSERRMGVHPGFDGMFGTPDDVRGSPGVVRSDAADRYAPDATFGLQTQVTGRWAPTAIGAQFSPALFWDGRAAGTFIDPQTSAVSIPAGGALESQVVGPPLSDVEMAHGNRDWPQITAKLASARPLALASGLPGDLTAALTATPTYPALFTSAFGDPTISAERIAFAIATYERTLRADQTPMDAMAAGNPFALTMSQRMGFMIFQGVGRCTLCHSGQTFSNHQFANIGLRPAFEDLGRGVVTGNAIDRGTFKVPTLRNVGLREAYMHTGRFTSLAQVVDFYNRGGDFNAGKDPRIIPLGLTPGQRASLVDFLTNALTDPRVANATGVFSRPILRSETHPFGSNLFGLENAGAGGFVPRMLAHVPANLGHSGFKIGLADALGGVDAYLGVSLQPQLPPFLAGGIPVNLDLLHPSFGYAGLTTQGGGHGAGYATVPFPLPQDPALAGVTVFVQWWVVDPNAAGGLAGTQGAALTIF